MDLRRTLLRGIVDYAGLFPPAKLPMQEAVDEYARQRAGEWSWMLGAFVVPVSRLVELDTAAGRAVTNDPWPLSILPGEDALAGVSQATRFVAAQPARFSLSAVEWRPQAPGDVATLREVLPDGVELFCELSADADPGLWMPVLKAAGARAKLRCGGIEPGQIPTVRQVIAFLEGCAEYHVNMKLTAGLHHPVRAEYPLSYEPGAPRGVMHGFLNVFLAAGLVAEGGIEDSDLTELLYETDPGAFCLEPSRVAWRQHVLAVDTLGRLRDFAHSFGSCSFSEPIHDLQTLGIL